MPRPLRALAVTALTSLLVPGRALANDLIPDSGIARVDASGTVLPDGTIIISGGTGSPGTQYVQRYDPFTNEWLDGGQMNNGHAWHELGRRRDGGVVLGDNGGNCELYDLDSNAWFPKGAWGIPREAGVFLETADGRFLAVAGQGPGPAHLPVREIEELGHDGGWSTVGMLAFTAARGSALVLPDGDLLVVGGYDAGLTPAPWAQRFSRADGGFVQRAAASMNVARQLLAAVLLPNGRVLAAGGVDFYSTPIPAELYDPVSDVWLDAGFTSAGRSGSSATLMPNGKVYIAGGQGRDDSADIYDPDGGTWVMVPLAVSRAYHVAAVLPTGEVFVYAGVTNAGNGVTYSGEVYDPSVPTVSAAPVLGTARLTAAAAVVVTNSSTLVLGGVQGASALSSTERLAPGASAWTPGAAMATPRARPVAVTLADGRILVTGGGATVEVFDPGDQAFHPAAPLADGRDGHALVRLASGRVLAVGGTVGGQALVSAEVYDPGQDHWTRVGDLPRAGAEMTATLLPSGQVLVAGGVVSGGTPSVDAFLFSEGTMAFVPALPMGTARREHSATMLNNGKVLVTGGIGASGPVPAAEWFDPKTGGWATLAPMGTARSSHSTVLLQNGKVLIAGGDGAGSTELFDVVPKVFRPGPPLGSALSSSTAVMMEDHRVLLVGATASAYFDEGRDARPEWTPRLDPPPAVTPGSSLSVTGGLFTGVSTGTGNNTHQVPANLPLFTARLPGGADVRLRGLLWDTTSAGAHVPAGTPIGPYAVTVTVNGVPSASRTLWIGGTQAALCSVPGDCLTLTCDAGACDAPPQQPAGICLPWCDVGCGCSTADATVGLWALALVLLRRWRRSPSSGSRPGPGPRYRKTV